VQRREDMAFLLRLAVASNFQDNRRNLIVDSTFQVLPDRRADVGNIHQNPEVQDLQQAHYDDILDKICTMFQCKLTIYYVYNNTVESKEIHAQGYNVSF
jgi:hypothetical protein